MTGPRDDGSLRQVLPRRLVALAVAALIIASTAVTAAIASAASRRPEFAGTYRLRARIPEVDYSVEKRPDDGLINLDERWVTVGGSCSAGGCSVRLRRVGADGRFLPVTLHSRTPGGAYTAQLAGHDRDACQHARVRESMLVRLFHVHRERGRLVAARVYGHIYGTWRCEGSVDEAVADYNGRRTGR